MKEGWWINYRRGDHFEVFEHEVWLRTPGNAKKLGVPSQVISDFDKFTPVEDRDKFLVYVMKNAPVMRVRGHGADATFEYHNRQSQDPLDEVLVFSKRFLGPFSTLNINNMATGQFISMSRKDFEGGMDEGVEAILRAASVKESTDNMVLIRELVRVAEEVAGKKNHRTSGSRSSRTV